MPFSWTPTTGLNDTSAFPSKDTSFRTHMQSLLDQVKDYMNNSLENTALLSANGWFKDKKTGVIEQWGTFNMNSVPANSVGSVNGTLFPIAFPTACTCVNFSIQPYGAWDFNSAGTNGVSNTSFNVSIKNGATSQTFQIAWHAIGY